jgi:hypothetical protein
VRPKIKLDVIDPQLMIIPKEEHNKRDLSKPKKVIAQQHVKLTKKEPPPPQLSLERVWQEIQRVKNSKVDYGEFYKLQRRLEITNESLTDAVTKVKDKTQNSKRTVEITASQSKIPGLLEMMAQATAAQAAADALANSTS